MNRSFLYDGSSYNAVTPLQNEDNPLLVVLLHAQREKQKILCYQSISSDQFDSIAVQHHCCP